LHVDRHCSRPPRQLAEHPEPARDHQLQDRAQHRADRKAVHPLSTGLQRSLNRIRADRILHEAATTGADPLHLSLVFNISHTTAIRSTSTAAHLLNDELERTQQ
jgi:hypothetical protein